MQILILDMSIKFWNTLKQFCPLVLLQKKVFFWVCTVFCVLFGLFKSFGHPTPLGLLYLLRFWEFFALFCYVIEYQISKEDFLLLWTMNTILQESVDTSPYVNKGLPLLLLLDCRVVSGGNADFIWVGNSQTFANKSQAYCNKYAMQ